MLIIVIEVMIEIIKDNASWLTPVFVAIVSGVFYLLKKGNSQSINNVSNSHINQAGGNINEKEDKKNA